MKRRSSIPREPRADGSCAEFRLHEPRVRDRLPIGQRLMECRRCGDT